jgi:hypothetical protein
MDQKQVDGKPSMTRSVIESKMAQESAATAR